MWDTNEHIATTNETNDMLCRHFKEILQQFMASDEAFVSMNTIKETPAQWKKLLHDVLAMMK